jgi:hypothetical protein
VTRRAVVTFANTLAESPRARQQDTIAVLPAATQSFTRRRVH